MRVETLEILRCPYCGGRLELVTSLFHRREGDEIGEGILGCHCCVFPVVAGIPVLHLLPAAVAAREHMEAARPALALRAMVGLADAREAEAFEAASASDASTYKEVVEALGPNFEGGYFLYRFSDPTYLVAHAVVGAVGGVVLQGTRRAADICGGSGHLTRTLLELSAPAPVLADLYFAKAWLARRFTAPGCEAVCCDGNAPLPFARGAFAFAMCSDAFQYIWTKRQFVAEMTRLVEEGGAVVINHTHNQLTWSPSHGQPLSPAGYRDLFETIEPRIFGEGGLLTDIVANGALDLSRIDPGSALDADPALTIVATRHPQVFRRHAVDAPARARGEFRINPLYDIRQDGGVLRLTLRFPSGDYEDEYGACREYLPQETSVDVAALRTLQAGGGAGPLADLIRRRVIVDLPKRYY
jgi:uncharacterized protein YbaR (Trm112 family)/SAM-dependent methyltransferase